MPYFKILPAFSLVYSLASFNTVHCPLYYSACAFLGLPRRRLNTNGVKSRATGINSIVDVAKPKAARPFS